MREIRVDLNDRWANDCVPAAPRTLGEGISMGERVVVIDPEEPEIQYVAVVHEMRADGVAILQVDWNSRKPTEPSDTSPMATLG